MEQIKYYHNKNIDKKRWDECIANSTFPIIYATSTYLDIVTNDNWGAYISNNYKILIPIFIKNKYGIKLLIQPPFTQQLGIFTSNSISKIKIGNLISLLKNKHSYISLKLNQNNVIESKNISLHKTFIIDLQQNYKTIYNGYTKNTKRNLKKAINSEVNITPISPNEFYNLYSTKIKNINFNKADLPILKKLLNYANQQNSTNILGCFKDNRLTAVSFWVEKYNRIIILAGISTDEGYNLRSMFALHNYKIEQNSGQNKIYDFEGSMIKNIAKFFSGFGSNSTYYPYLKQNKLPFPLNKILK